MASIGEQLRHERESRDKSLRQMGEATGIGVTYLEALERDDFNALPGRAFGKLYIRAYAEALGFDPQPLVDEYEREQRLVPVDGRPSHWRPDPSAAGEEATSVHGAAATRSPRWKRLLAATALLAGVAIVAALYFGRGGGGDPEPGAAPPIAPPAVSVPPAPPPDLPPPAPIPPGRVSVTDSGVGRRVLRNRLEGTSDRFAPGEVVWFQTRVVGGHGGETVRHVWIFDGRPQQTITLQLGASDWRTHSNKTIHKPGSWTVEARDEGSRVLATVAFTCAPTGEKPRR